MPTIEEIIEAQRVKLAAGQYGALSRIQGAYTQAAATATHRLETTSSELTRQRMSILLSGIEDELTKAAAKTIPLIKGQQAAVQLEAGKDFAELLQHFELAARIDPLANERMFAALSPESPLATLLGKANMAGLTAARMALFTGVALGDNPLKIAPKLREALDIPRWRAQTIARTEVLRSYRGSIRSRMKLQGFGHWRWISARDRRTCAMCWAQHGKIFPVEEAMGTHPNCRCSQAPLGDSTELNINGEQDFANLAAGAQREVLGSAKFNAYKAGAINLGDLVGTRQDAQWGTVRFEKSLLSILGNAAEPFYKGGKLPSNFQKQILKQHEDAVAKAQLEAMATAAAAEAAAQALKQAQAQLDAQIAATKAAATAKASAAAKKGAATKALKAYEAAAKEIATNYTPATAKKFAKALAAAQKAGLDTNAIAAKLAGTPPTPAPSTPPAGTFTTATGQYTMPTRGGHVSMEEHNALTAYQDGQYTAWNSYLRQTAKGLTPSYSPSAKGLQQMRDLDGLLARSAVTDRVLYRRVNTPVETLKGVGVDEGKTWTEHGYMSTSGDPIVSFGQTQYVITIPAGVNAKGFLMPAMGSENERLLARNSQFHVDRIEGSKFYMTYVGVGQ